MTNWRRGPVAYDSGNDLAGNRESVILYQSLYPVQRSNAKNLPVDGPRGVSNFTQYSRGGVDSRASEANSLVGDQ
jgi:hypothetical protein